MNLLDERESVIGVRDLLIADVLMSYSILFWNSVRVMLSCQFALNVVQRKCGSLDLGMFRVNQSNDFCVGNVVYVILIPNFMGKNT